MSPSPDKKKQPKPRPLSVSIVINTCNRAHVLHKTLDSFNHLHYDNFEVIVVNGPSTDHTEGLCEQYAGRIKTETCPKENLSMSRNVGIRAAAGDLVAFIDDDALPADEYWLDRYVEAFTNDPDGKLGIIGAPVYWRDSDKFEFKSGFISDYAMQVFCKSDGEEIVADGIRVFPSIMGCNNCARRTALLEIGGFDEVFKYYLDESDIVVKMARHGYRIEELPDNGVRHYKQTGTRRKSLFNLNWDTITRSDTYFSLVHGSDGYFGRLRNTLHYAPQKHFYREIKDNYHQGRLTSREYLAARAKWLKGFSAGLALGLAPRRRKALDPSHEPPAFLRFKKARPERPLHVCILSQDLPPNPNSGGIGRYSYDQARELYHLGHRVTVLTKGENGIRREGLGFEVHEIPWSDYGHETQNPEFPVVSRNAAYSKALFRKVIDLYGKGYRFDVVESSNWDFEGVAFALEPVLPFVTRVNSPMAQVAVMENWPFTDDLMMAIRAETLMLADADAVAWATTGVLETVNKRMGLDLREHHYTRNIKLGIPAEPWLDREIEYRQQGPQIHVLFVGRLERRKGIHVLLEALPGIMERFPNLVLDIVGKDVGNEQGILYGDSFRNAHTGKPWLRRVLFHGAVEDDVLWKLYRRCDIFVAPSLYESFGLIYMEAMRYGKPVVGCHTGGVPEVVTDGVDGFVVPPDDAPALADAIAKLVDSPQLREEFGRAGRDKLLHRINSAILAKNMAQLYCDVIDRTREKYAGRLEQYLPIDLPLHDNPRVVVDPACNKRVTPEEKEFLMTWEAGCGWTATVGHPALEITFMAHAFSGVAKVTVDGEVVRYVDLYAADGNPPRTVLLELGEGEHAVRVENTREKNPLSQGYEVWTERLTAYPQANAARLDVRGRLLERLEKTAAHAETCPA